MCYISSLQVQFEYYLNLYFFSFYKHLTYFKQIGSPMQSIEHCKLFIFWWKSDPEQYLYIMSHFCYTIFVKKNILRHLD